MIGPNIAVDFGSASTAIYIEKKGLVMQAPTLLAVDRQSGEPVYCGEDTYNINGREDEQTKIVRPVKNGVVSDYKYAEFLLTYYIETVLKNSVLRPNVMMVVPSETTSLDRRTFFDILFKSSAGRVCLMEEPLAAVRGMGIKKSIKGRMLINLGGGTVDIAVITMGDVAVRKTLKVGGIDLDNAITDYLLKTHDIEIGPKTAEKLKTVLGSAQIRNEELAYPVSGKSALDNMPISFEMTSTEIYECIKDKIEEIIRGIIEVLEITPPELLGDVAETGIIITGGTSLLHGIKEYIEKSTGIKTFRSKDAFYTTVSGAAKSFANMDEVNANGIYFLERKYR